MTPLLGKEGSWLGQGWKSRGGRVFTLWEIVQRTGGAFLSGSPLWEGGKDSTIRRSVFNVYKFIHEFHGEEYT